MTYINRHSSLFEPGLGTCIPFEALLFLKNKAKEVYINVSKWHFWLMVDTAKTYEERKKKSYFTPNRFCY